MIDAGSDVMKTFNDYSDETTIKFIRFEVPSGHKWCEKALKDILLPPDTLAVLIVRNGEKLIPDGNTLLLNGDELILAAESSPELSGLSLSEIYIGKNHKYIGKKLCDIPKRENSLVIMINRGGHVVIPRGDTELAEGDTLVINKSS